MINSCLLVTRDKIQKSESSRVINNQIVPHLPNGHVARHIAETPTKFLAWLRSPLPGLLGCSLPVALPAQSKIRCLSFLLLSSP